MTQSIGAARAAAIEFKQICIGVFWLVNVIGGLLITAIADSAIGETWKEFLQKVVIKNVPGIGNLTVSDLIIAVIIIAGSTMALKKLCSCTMPNRNAIS